MPKSYQMPANGATLPNGATVLEIFQSPASGNLYVLACTNMQLHPFATWRLHPASLVTEHGVYHKDLSGALPDVIERAGGPKKAWLVTGDAVLA